MYTKIPQLAIYTRKRVKTDPGIGVKNNRS